MPKRVKNQMEDPALSEMQRLAGQRIRAIRSLGGITQEGMSALLGVDQTTWSKWELGDRMPDVAVMIRFAARSKTSLDLIYRGVPIGTHPALLQLLRLEIPHLLVAETSDTEPDKDTALTSYKFAIGLTR